MILLELNIGRLTIAVFKCWLGFGYKDFHGMGKRLDFGFIKFWLDAPYRLED